MAEPDALGWSWFEAGDGAADGPAPDAELCRCFARCFAGPDGEAALDHLRRVILDRRCPPGASDAELRHLEGQRFAVAYVRQMVERGRG